MREKMIELNINGLRTSRAILEQKIFLLFLLCYCFYCVIWFLTEFTADKYPRHRNICRKWKREGREWLSSLPLDRSPSCTERTWDLVFSTKVLKNWNHLNFSVRKFFSIPSFCIIPNILYQVIHILKHLKKY